MSVRHISVDERRARLAQRHRLTPDRRTDDLVEIADAVVALHSSDPASVYLSAAARMASPALEAVSSALYDARSLLRHHGMRRTIWVATPEMTRAIHAACTSALALLEWRRFARLLEESGIAADGSAWIEHAREEVLGALALLGSSTARALGKTVPALQAKLQLAPGKPYAGTQGAHTRVMQNLGFDGVIARGRPSGSWASSEYIWSAMEDWLPGGVHGMDERAAVTTLVERYLLAFGPVRTEDVRWWTGLAAGKVTPALAEVGAVEVNVDGGPAWVHPSDVDPVVEVAPWVALLPSLDPTTMGWKQRAFILGELGGFGGPLFDRNGNAGPTVWVDGRVVGAWAQRADGTIATGLLVDVPKSRRREIDHAAARLGALIADVRISPRFPTTLQKELAR